MAMAEIDVHRHVQEHPFFAAMAPHHCATASMCTKLVHVAVDDYLFHRGEPANEFYLLQQGRIGLQWLDPGVTFLTLGEEEFLGISWVAPPRRWTCDAIAFEPVTALAVDAARLQNEWESDHAFGFACLRRILPIFQSRLDHARFQSLDHYG
jgi:CRP/FNR family cyclic AMP-dependent transcriptional regulator